jgi:hypothetical protein
MKLITVATDFNLAGAELIRSRLEAAGFHPLIANENASQWLVGLSTASLLRVEVPETELAAAKVFLAVPAE